MICSFELAASVLEVFELDGGLTGAFVFVDDLDVLDDFELLGFWDVIFSAPEVFESDDVGLFPVAFALFDAVGDVELVGFTFVVFSDCGTLVAFALRELDEDFFAFVEVDSEVSDGASVSYINLCKSFLAFAGSFITSTIFCEYTSSRTLPSVGSRNSSTG